MTVPVSYRWPHRGHRALTYAFNTRNMAFLPGMFEAKEYVRKHGIIAFLERRIRNEASLPENIEACLSAFLDSLSMAPEDQAAPALTLAFKEAARRCAVDARIAELNQVLSRLFRDISRDLPSYRLAPLYDDDSGDAVGKIDIGLTPTMMACKATLGDCGAGFMAELYHILDTAELSEPSIKALFSDKGAVAYSWSSQIEQDLLEALFGHLDRSLEYYLLPLLHQHEARLSLSHIVRHDEDHAQLIRHAMVHQQVHSDSYDALLKPVMGQLVSPGLFMMALEKRDEHELIRLCERWAESGEDLPQLFEATHLSQAEVWLLCGALYTLSESYDVRHVDFARHGLLKLGAAHQDYAQILEYYSLFKAVLREDPVALIERPHQPSRLFCRCLILSLPARDEEADNLYIDYMEDLAARALAMGDFDSIGQPLLHEALLLSCLVGGQAINRGRALWRRLGPIIQERYLLGLGKRGLFQLLYIQVISKDFLREMPALICEDVLPALLIHREEDVRNLMVEVEHLAQSRHEVIVNSKADFLTREYQDVADALCECHPFIYRVLSRPTIQIDGPLAQIRH